MSDQEDKETLFNSWDLNFSGYDYDEYFEDYKPQEKVKCGNEEGYACIKCNEFYPFATLNQQNKTFKCWSCRNGLSIPK